MKHKHLIVSLICLFVAGFVHQAKASEEDLHTSISNDIQIVRSDNITPIESFKKILSELDEADLDTLVVFDIDDVLITYKDMVLRPCGAHFCPLSWEGIDPKEIFFLMSIMLSEGQIILVDPSIPQLINKLKIRGVRTIAFTAARTGKFGVIENAEDWRLKVLKRFHMDFSVSFPQNQIIYFDNAAKNESDYSIFKKGVLFLGEEKISKGVLLLQFLDKVQWKPKNIVFVDDKMSHLESVETALKATKISFQGYQYKGIEKLSEKLDEKVAEVQFSYLRKNHKWLSDTEAKKEEKCLLVPHQ